MRIERNISVSRSAKMEYVYSAYLRFSWLTDGGGSSLLQPDCHLTFSVHDAVITWSSVLDFSESRRIGGSDD